MEDNRQRQQDEITALKAIFGDSAVETDDASDHTVLLVYAPLDTTEAQADIRFHLPTTYPSQDPPFFEWIAAKDTRAELFAKDPGLIHLSRKLALNSDMQTDIENELRRMWLEDMCQDVVIFSWLSWLDTYFSEHWPRPLDPVALPKDSTVSSKNNHACSDTENTVHAQKPTVAPVSGPEIFTGPPSELKKSVFVAHVARVKSAEDVQKVLDTLMQNRKIAQATHNILAYRVQLENGSISQDNDDDGETAAGKRLGHLLKLLDVLNIMVVVTRWYGGIHLGPDRFKLINNAARQALQEGGFI